MAALLEIRATCAIATALMLAACGGGESETPAPAALNAAGEATLNYQTEVAGLTEAGREAVFIRAIRDAGLPCEGVESATETEPGSFVYDANCIDGTKHQVAIAANGDARVTSAARAR